MRSKLLISLTLVTFASCVCDTPVPPDGEINAVISGLPAEVGLGDQVPLDASDSSDGPFNVEWRVDEPIGCDRSAPAGPTDVATTFVALCPGVHEVELRVTPIGGGEESVAIGTFDVVVPDGFLELALDEVVNALLDQEAVITLDFDVDSLPAGLIGEDGPVTVVVTPEDGAAQPEVSFDPLDARIVRLLMVEAHARYSVELGLSLADGELVSETPVTATVETLNSAPDIAAVTVAPFESGESTTITGTAVDLDEDVVTCSLSFAPENIGPEFGLPTDDVTGDCAFALTPPEGLLAWTLRMAATDAFGGVDDDTNTFVLTPNNAPPTLEPLATGDRVEIAYTCDGSTCTSDSFTIDMVATDDFDDAADLVYELVDTGGGLGTFEVTPDPVVTGRFSARLTRDDVGPLAGERTLEARVTEVTAAEGVDANTTVEEFTLAVLNTTPLVNNVIAPGVNHTFDGAYRSTIDIAYEIADPEGNASATVTLVTCPDGNAPAADACGDVTPAALSQTGDSAVAFDVSSATLAPLIGTYGFDVVVVDADGAQSTSSVNVSVGNRPPEAVANQGLVSQSFVSPGVHQAVLPVFVDLDGDPLTVTDLTPSCPTGNCVATIVAANDGSVTATSAPVAAFLGTYTIDATVSDSVETITDGRTITVINTPPFLTIDDAASTSARNHQTVNGVVTIDSAEASFPLVGSLSDINGDPISFVETETFIDLTFNGSDLPSGAFSITYDVSMAFSDFAGNTGTASRLETRFRAVDPFGDESEDATVTPLLLNRDPVSKSVSIVFSDNNIGIDALRMHESRTSLGSTTVTRHDPEFISGNASVREIGYEQTCFPQGGFPAVFCSHFIPIDITATATDPDGDPLTVSHRFQCDGGDLAVPTEAFVPFEASSTVRLTPGTQSCGVGSARFFTIQGSELFCQVTSIVADADTVGTSLGLDTDTIRTSFSTANPICQ